MNKVYFDTDVLIHLLISQEPDKAELAYPLYKAATDDNRFFVSLLCLQEVAYVLHRLGQQPDNIERMLNTFLPSEPVSYDLSQMMRGIQLAKSIGFQNISDCIHTAIAEDHCTELITFNKSDFKRIQKFSKLKITVL